MSSLLFNLASTFYPALFAQTEQAQLNWVKLVIGIALILGLIGLLIWLQYNGKLVHWAQSGIQRLKYALQISRFGNEIKQSNKTKETLLNELGQKAWEARISDPAYEKEWVNLEALEEQIASITNFSQSLQEQAIQLSKQHEDLSRDFDDQLAESDKARKETEGKLKYAQAELYRLESDIDALANQKASLQREIKSTRSDRINAESSDEPDRFEILSALNIRLDDLVARLLSVSNEEPELAGRIPAFQSEVISLNSRLTELDQQIRQIEGQKSQELEPLEKQLDSLEKQIKQKANEVKETERKMEPLINNLGERVDKARPASEVLQEFYNSLDASQQQILDITNQREETNLNIQNLDSDAARNFYLLVIGGLLVLLLGIFLITGVL